MPPQSPIPNPQSSPPSGGIQGGAAIDFMGVRIFAERHGNRVTGRVEFPAIFNRQPVPLSYERPDSPSNPQSAIRNPQSPRLAAVQRYQEALRDYQGPRRDHRLRTRLQIANEIAHSIGVTGRTLQLWARKFEIDGKDALLDHYTPTPARKVTCDSSVATDAVLVCAWWSFRIGNVKVIASPMIASAAQLLQRWTKGDVLAAIDCYFAWPCNRSSYPFKRFAKWLRYDFETWLLRAREDPAYRDAVTASKSTPTPLHLPEPSRDREGAAQSAIRNPQSTIKARRHLVNRATREAFKALDQNRDRDGAAPLPPLLRGDQGGSQSAIRNPQSAIWDALASLTDAYRRMLLAATRGDRGCREEAIATIWLWWDFLPSDLRGNVAAKIAAWAADHPRAHRRDLTARRTDLVLAAIRHDRRTPRPIAAAL